MNTKKLDQIAEKLRDMAEDYSNIASGLEAELNMIADEISGPRPDPGTVVEFYLTGIGKMVGYATKTGVTHTYHEVKKDTPDYLWSDVSDVKVVGILPSEIAVKVLPPGEWPRDAHRAELRWYFEDHTHFDGFAGVSITRKEAEAKVGEDRHANT